jgi:hypothetical protein
MNKNIYVDLADKLDSIGLYQESDEITKIFSSTNSFIKTAQSSELDAILGDSEKLTGWNWFWGVLGQVSGLTSVPTAILSFNKRLKQLEEQYFEEKEVAAVPDEFNAKTYDAKKINLLKKESFDAMSSSKPKTEIQILIPNNEKPFDPGDNQSYTIEKYKVPKTIEKKRRNGTIYEAPNPTIAEFTDPSNYIKDKVLDGIPQFVEVPRKTYINHLPAKNDDEFTTKKRNAYFSSGLKLLAVATGVGIATAIGYETQWKLYKNSLNSDIKAEYRKYLIKNKYQAKNNKDKSIILEEFTSKLNSILKQCDGVGNPIKSPYPKEKFRDAILRLFKKEIGFGVNPNNTNPGKTNPSNTNSTTQKPNSGAPSSKSRPQTRPLRPSQPEPAPSGGSIREQGV